MFYKALPTLVSFIVFSWFMPTSSFSQISTQSGIWEPIGNTKLSTRYDDTDELDGLNDGAVAINGQDTNGPLGAQYTFQGTMKAATTYDFNTSVYNYKSSYIHYYVQLYNLTKQVVLTSSLSILIEGYDTSPEVTSLSYTTTDNDEGDQLQIRYVRENTSGSNHTARDFAVDYIQLNDSIVSFGDFFYTKPTIDIPKITPTTVETEEMDLILSKMSNYMLGLYAPSGEKILEAIEKYNDLNITIDGNLISGDMPTPDWDITVWQSADFLKIFAQYLKYYPNEETKYVNGLTMKEMASNTVWFFTDQFARQKIPKDYINYFYKLFAVPTIFLKPILSDKINNLFDYSLIEHSHKYENFWNPTYIFGISSEGAINIDDIGNLSDIHLVYGLMQDTPEAKLQWTKGFRRYFERFMSYTPGTADGIKTDGSSFHHQTGLNNYTYNYNKPTFILSVLDGTSFQVSVQAYEVFRKGVYTQIFISNDNMEPLSMAGRHPETRGVALSKSTVSTLAIVGGHILGLTTPDPLLAEAYVRHWGNHPDLPNVQPEKLLGFKPMNYHGAGIYWRDHWMAVSRGESSWSFGAEMIRDHQHYGRYQSYGTLEIIYEGGQEAGNGYRFNGWNWNYNPGATSIVLPWNLLRVENKYQKEYQKKSFVGALSFDDIDHGVYQTMGQVGLFAMDFHERENIIGYEPFSPLVNRETTFAFKKSVFFFEDYILALGSNIQNEDATHPTVTTLYQRLSENQDTVIVNGSSFSKIGSNSFNGSNWIIDNFHTGFYVVNNSDNQLGIKRTTQKIPYLDDFDFSKSESRPGVDYSIGYIAHGTNPIDASYEYVVIPKTSIGHMSNFATAMSTASTKPYIIHQKNKNAHIISDKMSERTAYVLFSENNSLPNDLLIEANDTPCLIIYKMIGNNLKLSIANPNMGFNINSFEASLEVPIKITLKGKWTLLAPNIQVQLVSSTSSSTTFQFNTFDGKPIAVNLSQIVGIEPIQSPQFSVFPNPTTGFVNITFSDSYTGNINITIRSSNGKKIQNWMMHKKVKSWHEVINLADIPIGNYVLNILLEDGRSWHQVLNLTH